ncbi:MAG: hypothetical protein K8T25_08630 [Planctomycetia bacterium]|nr:hypothetical protein [Planctomycetia bacterium]
MLSQASSRGGRYRTALVHFEPTAAHSIRQQCSHGSGSQLFQCPGRDADVQAISDSIENTSMSANEAVAAAGFLTVVRSDPHGLIGGYLVLNATGRPLEFHCTAPIKPNRAQEILYGPTLEPFLYGEQIGQTLLAAAKVQVPLVCTDLAHVLAVADFAARPVVLVLETPDEPEQSDGARPAAGTAVRIDRRHALARPLTKFHIGRHGLALAAGRDAERPEVEAVLSRLGESFDLAEPFGRIREAIEEAQRGTKTV